VKPFFAVDFYWRTKQTPIGRSRFAPIAGNVSAEIALKNDLPQLLVLMMLPGENEQRHEAYRRAVSPATAENNFEIAEKMLREALPLFRRHYKTEKFPIIANECKLPFVLAKQEKWVEFEIHSKICRQGAENLSDKPGTNLAIKKLAEISDEPLGEKSS
jgi:hypothetical protein